MNSQDPAPQIHHTKQHFVILDGLRGVAALAVVVFHFMEWVFPDSTQNFIGHGFLAVDFFFCLSGFVIGYAYDNRIRIIGFKEFFRFRLIRLHPLVVFGSVLGLLGFIFDPFALPAHYSTGTLALYFLCSLFLIPLPLMQERAYNLFPLNAPSWSLFWEYVANVVYAFVLCKMNRRLLIMLTLFAAAGICVVSYRAGNLLGGWSGSTFWDGGVRVVYSFSAGLLLYRSGWMIRNRLGFPLLSVLLLLAFLMPGSRYNWLTEPLIVLFYFPLIVSLGAGSVASSGWIKICRLSGNLSYPLYMTHYAAIWVFGNWLTNNKPPAAELPFVIIAGVVFLVAFGWLIMILYDIPLRKYLTKRRTAL